MNIRYYSLLFTICLSVAFASLAFADTKTSTITGDANSRPVEQLLTQEEMSIITQGLNESRVTRDCHPAGEYIECCTTTFPGGKWCVTCYDKWKGYKQISHDCGPKDPVVF